MRGHRANSIATTPEEEASWDNKTPQTILKILRGIKFVQREKWRYMVIEVDLFEVDGEKKKIK
jgi:hypothetical protein